MTITLELSPEIESTVRDRAAENGQEPAEFLRDLVTQAIGRTNASTSASVGATTTGGDNPYEEEYNPDALEGIQRGLADMDAGRTVSLEESRAHTKAAFAARHGQARE